MTFKNLFKKKKVNKIVVTFTTQDNGDVTTRITMDGKIGIALAQDAIGKMQANIAHGLRKRVSEARYSPSNPEKTRFIQRLTIADIMKTKTLKY